MEQLRPFANAPVRFPRFSPPLRS